jgi:Fe-S-cluster-containing dehydrogenase component
MEKCTFCVQRIQNTRILARNEHRPIGPNEIKTACQVACPTGSIVFGNMADRASDVHKNHRNVRAYQLLEQLGNLPRTRYLARVRNPNPALLTQATTPESHS